MPGKRQTPTVRLRRLAAELRALRASSGLTRDEVVERTGINVATMYRIEHARVRPQTRTLRTLLDLYGVDKEQQTELVALLRDARERGWLHAYQSELPEQYMNFIGFEGEAETCVELRIAVRPWPAPDRGLRPRRHPRRASRSPAVTRSSVGSRSVWSGKRCSVARTRSNCGASWTRRPYAARLAAQRSCGHSSDTSLEASDLPNVTFQVIPFDAGAHPGMPGSFIVLQFAEEAIPDVIYVETHGRRALSRSRERRSPV